MHYSIDRFEENMAVLQDDDGNSLDIDRTALPDDASQGDIVIFKGGRWVKDPDETAKRRAKVLKLQQKLLNKSKTDNSR